MTAFRHILVPTDFSDTSGQALALALELAAKFESQVTLVHVWSIPPVVYANPIYWPEEALRVEAKRALDEALTNAKARYPKTDAVLAQGVPWESILEAAAARAVDLIVMGTHGRRGLSHVLLGSQAERVVRLSPVPVLTVSEGGARRARPASAP